MFFNQYLAIDYGTTYIKGILFKQIMGGVTILRNESLKIVNLEEGNPDEYEYNIVRFIQSFFPEETSFLINIPIDKLFIRDLRVPLSTAKAIKEVIPFEVENLIPFPVDTMEVLGSIWKMEQDNSNVITFSAHHKELEKTVHPFLRNDIQLRSISVDCYALGSVISRHFGGAIQSERVGQVDIGGRITIFNAINHGRMTHSRFFANGGHYVTEKIADLLKVEYQEAEDLKTSIPFAINKFEEEEKLAFMKKYRITPQQFKSLMQIIMDSLDMIAEEINRSIYSLEDTEKPDIIYLSGGGSLIKGTEEFLSDKLHISIARYDFMELTDSGYITCMGTGYHYQLKRTEKLDFINTNFVKSINKNTLNLSYFRNHFIMLGISFFILITVFFVGVIIDKRKIRANNEILAKKFHSGFAMEVPPDEDVIDVATREVKKEQKNSEIVRLFLSQDSILDLIMDISMNFPSKENLNFVLDQFSYDANEVQIYGRVDEFSELGTIQAALNNSKKFKNVEVMNKRLIQGVNKLKVSFKIKLEVATGQDKQQPVPSGKEEGDAE